MTLPNLGMAPVAGPVATAMVTILAALAFAAERHRGRRRKGAGEEPFIEHLIEVAALVADAANGDDPELVAAAILHDSLEDGVATGAEVTARFGSRVAGLVMECTDNMTLGPARHRARQVEEASGKSPGARLIKLADKTSNLRALPRHPPEAWPADRRAGYVQWARAAATGLRGLAPALDAAFDSAAEAADRHFDRLGPDLPGTL